jgi:hypothetical protein
LKEYKRGKQDQLRLAQLRGDRQPSESVVLGGDHDGLSDGESSRKRNRKRGGKGLSMEEEGGRMDD